MILNTDLENILSDPNIPWENFNDASVLITGATGLIGSLLAKALLAYKTKSQTNTKIIAVIRNIEKAHNLFGKNASMEYITSDIRQPIQIDCPIDYILHCASVTTSKYMVTNPVETIQTSIEGTKNILELAKEKKVKSLLYVSSMEVYGTTTASMNPITEEKLGYIDITNVRSSYSEGKRICELMCNSYNSQYGISTKIGRLAMTFGPGIPKEDNRMAMQFAKSAIASNDIILHTKGDSISNFCYTSDAIRGLFTILLKDNSKQAYNICNDSETRSVIDIAKLVATDICQNQIKVIINIPESNIFGFAPKTEMRLSSTRLQSLGWSPQVNMVTAYRNLITYLQE